MTSVVTITLSMTETARVMGLTKPRVSQMINRGHLKADKVLDADMMKVSWRVHTDSIRKRIAWLTEQNYWTVEQATEALGRLDKAISG